MSIKTTNFQDPLTIRTRKTTKRIKGRLNNRNQQNPKSAIPRKAVQTSVMHIEVRSESEGIREASGSAFISAVTAIERGLRDEGGSGGGEQWRVERRDPPSREPQHLGTLPRVRAAWIWAMRFPVENGERSSMAKRRESVERDDEEGKP